MFGIDFVEANNDLICGQAEFIVRQRTGADLRFKIGFNPQKTWLQKQNQNGEWETVHHFTGWDDEIEAILPTEFGKRWTVSEFFVALTFWGEGYSEGYSTGEQSARQMAREHK